MSPAAPALTRDKQMAIANLAVQQQAAACMAQQHLSAAAALGAIPNLPSQGKPCTLQDHWQILTTIFILVKEGTSRGLMHSVKTV